MVRPPLRIRWLLLAAIAAAVAGCSFDPGGLAERDAAGDDDDDDDDDDDVIGPDGGVDAGDAAGCVDECVGNGFRDCAAGGAIVECSVGCTIEVAGAPRCLSLVPSNGAGVAGLDGTSALAIANGFVFVDTDTGEIYGPGVGGPVYRAAGTGLVGDENGLNPTRFTVLDDGLSALHVASLTLGAAAYVVPIGVRALVIVAAGDVQIHGTIDFGGGGCQGDDDTCAGAGGGNGSDVDSSAEGCGPGGDGYLGGGDETGGGGGGLGQAGAPGGEGIDGMLDNPGGPGGTIAGCPGPTLVPLRGGSGGGAGGFGTGGAGGGGAGAVQITSLTRIELAGGVMAAMIYAGGGRGRLGGATGVNGTGGGGGGAGGGVLLEAPEVLLTTAVLAANGGGGGDGMALGNGAYGGFSGVAAQGGGSGASRGGNGGALIAPTAGAGPTDGTGGGGGAAGIIRINSFLPTNTAAAVVSPTPSLGPVATD